MHKSLISKLFVLLLVVGLLFAVAPTKQAQALTVSTWDGIYPTSAPGDLPAVVGGVQEVNTAAQFAWLASQTDMFPAGVTTVKLMVDIDLDNRLWTPSGGLASGSAATGNIFDGNGHTISNLRVVSSEAAGLFVGANGGEPIVQNLVIEGAYIEATPTATNIEANAAVVAVGIDGGFSFSNVTVRNATVKGTKYVAGISAYSSGLDADGGYYTNCTVENTLLEVQEMWNTGEAKVEKPHVGGIVGLMNKGTFSGNSATNLTITVLPVNGEPVATERVGALIGTAQAPVLVGTYDISNVTYNTAPYTKIIGLDVRTYKVVNTTQMLGYTTIQAAIDAANAGDVIAVSAGTYAEDLEIGKSITLLGPNAAISPNGGVRGAEAIVAPVDQVGVADPAVLITASNISVTIKGLTFDMVNTTDQSDRFVELINKTGVTMVVEKNQFLNAPSCINGNWYITGTTSPFSLTLKDNYFTGSKDSNGIALWGNGHTVDIQDNVWTDNGGWAVNFNNVTGTFNNNQVLDTIDNGTEWYDEQAGFLFASANTLNLTNNTFDGLPNPSIRLYPTFSGTLTATDNTFSNTEDTTMGVIRISDGAVLTGVNFEENLFLNNPIVVQNLGTGTASLDVTPNWWGQATGPTAAQIVGIADYIPWCADAACTELAGPVHNVNQGTFFSTIQAAIDATSTVAGDIIEVSAGIYPEAVNVNKSVTITGTGEIETFTYPTVVNDWYTDRYEPEVFVVDTFLGESVLKHGVVAADFQTNTFYNYQGKKFDITTTGPEQTWSIDLFVDPAWKTGKANAGFWATGYAIDGTISAYPIVAWRSGGTDPAGFYSFDYINGGWLQLFVASDDDYGKWHNFAMTYTVGTGVEYFVDGVSRLTFADPDTVKLSNIILNIYNFGEDYNVYWDNFAAHDTKVIGQMSINASDVAIEGLILSNPGQTYGMLIDDLASNIDITENIFEDIGSPTLSQNVKGVYLQYGPDDVLIQDNLFQRIHANTNSVNAIFSGDTNSTSPAETLKIQDNRFLNITSQTKGGYGILLNNGAGNPGAIIEGNSFNGISGGWTHAIGLEGPTPGALVNRNTFSGLTAAGADNTAVFFEANSGLATTSITNNQFLNAGFGVAVHPSMGTHPTVLASPNWWGQLTGPATEQLPPSGDYDSSPWCANAECTEFLPATATIAPVAPVVCGVTPTTTIDVNISGIPTSMVAQGYQLTLHFDPTKTSIASEDDIAQGGFLPLATGFTVRTIDNVNGTVVIASTIFGTATNDPSLPLAKITLTHKGVPGGINLTLSDVLLSDADGLPIPADGSTTPVVLTLQPAVLNTTKDPDAGYCSLAQAVEDAVDGDNLKLVADIAIPEMVTVDKELTLDLNGKTATVPVGVTALKVTSATGNLTIDDSATGGLITGGYYSVYVDGGADFTLDGGSLLGSDWGIHARGAGSSLTVNDGVIDAQYFAISGNGLPESAGTIIDINGGTISSDYTAIYLPQAGTVDISGGTITGHTGIEIKSGTLNISGGTITATGTYVVDPGEGDGGTVESGDAIFVISNPDYAGEMVISISGGTFTSATGYALREYVDEAFTDTAVNTLTVTGGTFIGGVETGEAGAAVTFSTQLTTLQAPELALQGGLYNTDPASPDVFVFVPYGTVLNGTMYEIVSISLNVHDFYYNNSGTLRGVSTDFYATNFLFSEASSVIVELFSGEEGSYVLQQTNTLKVPTNHPGSVLTSSFDFFGTYISNSWENDRETEFGQTVAPTRVLVTVVLPGGTLTAENTILTGDRTTILPGVNGLVTLQGILAPRAGVPIYLTSGSLVRDTTSTAMTDINYWFTGVETLTYTFTTSQARYLNITADSGKTFLVNRDLTLTPLRLYGGDVDQNNLIQVNDASLVGTDWGSTLNPEANINYDGIVNIQDLALVGGNFGLTSATAYNWWSPLP